MDNGLFHIQIVDPQVSQLFKKAASRVLPDVATDTSYMGVVYDECLPVAIS